MAMDFDQQEALQNALEALEEDAALLRLAFMGAQIEVGKLTLRCFLRLADALEGHVRQTAILCREFQGED